MQWFLKLFRQRSASPRSERRPKSYRPRVEALEDRLMPATFTVLYPGDSGQYTLRWAIEQANKDAIKDTIRFNMPTLVYGQVPTIKLLKPLPSITAPVILDGTSQPGGHRVELNGANAVPNIFSSVVHGLYIKGNDRTVKGLVINRFSGNGIVLVYWFTLNWK